MLPEDRKNTEGRISQRRGRFALFYFEQVGSRSYLRFTPLALFLIVGLTVMSAVLLFGLLLLNRSKEAGYINVNLVNSTPTPPFPARPRR